MPDAPTLQGNVPFQTDVPTFEHLPHATPPQGWQGGFDSSLSQHRLTANVRTMVDPSRPRVAQTESVAELIAPGVPVTRHTGVNEGVRENVSIQDWQCGLDSRLCARRQYRGQGL